MPEAPPSHRDSLALPGLPLPSSGETRHSEALTRHICQEMEAVGGSLDFARFMELALYATGQGYYTAGLQKFGGGGDFITAPELSPLFARCLARQVVEINNELKEADLLEVGAGSGALAVDLLLELERLGALPNNYFILELSPELRARQRARVKEMTPHLAERVRWLDALPGAGFRGVVLGNELLDAMPVECFRIGAGGAMQRRVAWEGGRFVWTEQPAGPETVRRLAPLDLPPGYASEINFTAEAWVRSIGDILSEGVVLLVDYGFPRAEFYHPQRSGGTLMCHYRHRVYHDPLILAGLQDITAHVDFTAIAEAGHEAGLSLMGYTTQAAFLIACGLDKLAAGAGSDNPRAHAQMVSDINKLTSPAEMGELYKVMALGRGLNRPLAGFQLLDRSGAL